MKSRYAIICAPALAVLFVALAVAQTKAPTGGLKGKVKDKSGKSLEGVVIRATSVDNKEEKRETKSNASGDFEFEALPAGNYSLLLEKQGYKTFLTRSLEITAGEPTKLSKVIELSREGRPYSVIRGAVLRGVGYTLPYATVTIERIDGKKFRDETLSQDGGEFAFRLKAEKARYRVTASAKGFQTASLEVEVAEDEARNIVLRLDPAN